MRLASNRAEIRAGDDGDGVRVWYCRRSEMEVTVTAEVAVVVLNWNGMDDTLRCLRSLESVSGQAPDVIVVDNGSSDGSCAAIKASHPNVRLIETGANLGYADGNNIGLRVAIALGYRYVMLLNNDTIVEPNAINALLERMEAEPDIGVAGPVICYLSQPEVVWSAGGVIDWHTGHIATTYIGYPVSALPEHPWDTDHVTGCCLLIRTEALSKAGLLDPRFFMYYEETEWCVRIARQGYRIVVVPQSRIWHDVAVDQHEGSPAVAYYMTRNHLLFLTSTKAPLSTVMRTLARQLRTLGSLFVNPHTPGRARGRVPMIRGLRDFTLRRFGPLHQTR